MIFTVIVVSFQSLFMDGYLYFVTLNKKKTVVSKKLDIVLCSLVLLALIAHMQTNSFTVSSIKFINYVNLRMAKMPHYEQFTTVYEIITKWKK